jgi:hypothetical protein
MKTSTMFKALVMVAGCCGVAAVADAATCSSTLGPITSTGPLTGNSCNNNLNFSGSTAMCGGVAFSTTGTDVWAIQLGASQNFTFTVSSSDFHPDVALWSGSCADNATCVNGTDYNSINPTAPFTITTTTYSGNAAGTYYIVITDSTAVGAQCGAYNLSFAGTLPVKLQKFSVN